MRQTMPTCLLLVLMAVVTSAGCDGSAAKAKAGQNEKEAPPVPVEVRASRRADVLAVYSGTATLEAEADAAILAKVPGEVVAILVEEGDGVHGGQVLARLDGDRLRLEEQQAQATLRKLQQEYERNVELHEKGLVSAGAFESLKYDLDALQAAYARAKLELSYTEIKAPFTGVVTERHIKVGNTLTANEPTFHLTDFDPLHAYLYVPEREFRKLQVGQVAEIRADALPETVFQGKVARISPVIDPDTGTFKVTVEVNDSTNRLKPGMFGRVNIVYDIHRDALLVPRSALLDDELESTVFVVLDGIAVLRTVETGMTQGADVEITKGLGDEMQVIVVGHTGLKDGASVRIVQAENPARP